MKHRCAMCALSLLLLFSPVAGMLAEENEITNTAESIIMLAAKTANLRKLPTTKSDLLERLDKGAKVELLSTLEAEDDVWAYVRVSKSKREGYMLLSLLAEPAAPAPDPTAIPQAEDNASVDNIIEVTASASDLADYDEPKNGITVKNVNLRKKPNGSIITQIMGKTPIMMVGEISEKGKTWIYIETEDGKNGYVLSEYVQIVVPAEPEIVSEEIVRKRYPVVGFDPLGDIKNEVPFEYTDAELAKYKSIDIGDSSQQVLAIRKRLYQLGYYQSPHENVRYTESTAEVIGFFQKDCGLEVTGTADPYTQALLFDPRITPRESSPQAIKYLQNGDSSPLQITAAEVACYGHFGTVQVSVENHTGGKMTRFALRVIPTWADGSFADMAPTFAEEIERVYSIRGLAVPNGGEYSDFDKNDLEEYGIYPHHFSVSRLNYFSGAHVAVAWYRTNKKTTYIDDDQMIYIPVGKGAGNRRMNVLPITVTEEEAENAAWDLGVKTHYVLPVYQEHYKLPQGAWVASVEVGSPAYRAGVREGDIIVGIGDVTILGDATLRQARGRMRSGETVSMTFWHEGNYYETELIRPNEDTITKK